MTWRKIEVDGKRFVIGKVQYAVMKMAQENGKVVPEVVWARFGIRWSFLVGAFERLERAGLISKNDDGTYSVTEIGEKVLKKADDIFYGLYVRGEL